MWIGIQSHAQMADRTFDQSKENLVVSIVFFVLFSLEILLQVVGMRWWYICGEEREWHALDVAMFAISVPELIVNQMHPSIAKVSNLAKVSKLLRMVRVLRLFRFVRVFQELRQMVVSIINTFKTLMWV